jgi:hypothetical protein
MSFYLRRLVIFFFSVAWMPMVHAAEPPLLPTEISDTLTREYPGWSYAKHPPHLLSGDFDGDGRADYAVQIARTDPHDEEQIAIAFLKRDKGYDEIILESRGLDSKVYLGSRNIPKSDSEPMHDLIVVAGGPTGDTAYIYQGKAFHEIEGTPPPEPPESQ